MAEDAPVVLRLEEYCVTALVTYRRFLGNVSYIEPAQVRRIVALCTRSELESVEDATLEGSGRDLTWYTWHLWHRIYLTRYGRPADDDLLPLPGEPPVDYIPVEVPYAPAHYRAMIEGREADEEARKAAAVSKLRAGYKAENRHKHGVEYTSKLPPPKRARTLPGTPAAQQKQLTAANAHRTLGGKPAVKVMNELGLGKLGKSLGRSGSSPQQHRPFGSPKPGGGKAAAAAQQQPSALACLARKPGAAAAGKPGSQQQQDKQARAGSSSGAMRPPGGGVKQQLAAAGPGARRQPAALAGSKRSAPLLLDTPVVLSGQGGAHKAGAGAAAAHRAAQW